MLDLPSRRLATHSSTVIPASTFSTHTTPSLPATALQSLAPVSTPPIPILFLPTTYTARPRLPICPASWTHDGDTDSETHEHHDALISPRSTDPHACACTRPVVTSVQPPADHTGPELAPVAVWSERTKQRRGAVVQIGFCAVGRRVADACADVGGQADAVRVARAGTGAWRSKREWMASWRRRAVRTLVGL